MVCFDNVERDPADKYDDDTAKLLADFAVYATENYGPKCADFEAECLCCKLWALHDQVSKLVTI